MKVIKVNNESNICIITLSQNFGTESNAFMAFLLKFEITEFHLNLLNYEVQFQHFLLSIN